VDTLLKFKASNWLQTEGDMRMRIAFVIYSLEGGGAERVTTILAQHWAAAKHDVKVITLADESINFYKPNAPVECESLNYARVSRNLWKTPFVSLRRALLLRRRLRAFQPDVVIGMMNTASVLVAMACFMFPARTIGTERIYPPLSPLSPARRFARCIAYRFLDVIIAQTKESAAWIRANTFAKAVRIIPNPLAWPLEATPPFVTPNSVCPQGRLVVLAVGRLVRQKGFTSLIEAFARVHPDHPAWDLVIVGVGPDRDLLETLRDRLGLKGHVFLPGRVGNIGDWYARASIFAMTSLFEGFPNALLEAMAYGLPVISTDCDTGPRDIIKHDLNGLLVEPGDQEALVAGLRQLIESEDLRTRLSDKARAVSTLFAVEHISQQWQAVFREINL
jgi:glycosyltransferase involved in cell wall biosynthesis